MTIKDQAYTIHFRVENIDTTAGYLGTGVTGLVNASFASYKLLQDGNIASVSDTSTLAELDATNAPGWYSLNIPSADNDGDFMVMQARCSTSTYYCHPAQWVNDDDPETIYYANIEFNQTSGGTGDDKWNVKWYKYGTVQTTQPTVPQIYVQDETGTDLITSGTAMSEVGSTGNFYFNADGSAGQLKVTAGTPVYCEVTATIDSATRTWGKWINLES